MSDQITNATQQWTRQLSQVQLPVLSEVMQELNSVTNNKDTSATELAEIILKDSGLTTKVLRVANSVYHNPGSSNQINTISRAVVQLGFQGIKAISLSVMLVDSLLQKSAKERMLQWMARGFHAAVQAENLFKQIGGSGGDEEVFITSLLLHIGDMAFWTCKSETAEKLDNALAMNSCGDDQVEREILGCSMKDITIALAEQWQLGPRLQQALATEGDQGSATEAVLLGEAISFASEKGWDSEEFKAVLVKASLYTGLGLDDVTAMIERGADQAAGIAVTYRANKICHYIPNTSESPSQPEVVVLKANPQLQLDILREMGSLVAQQVDVNTLFQMIVEGVHRGIGLDRVCLCLIDPKVTTMQVKYLLGDDTDVWREEMQFPIKSDQDNLFAHCLHSRINIWLHSDSGNQLNHLIDKKIERLLDTKNCMVSSIYAGSRPVGILLADRGRKNVQPIALEQHESFEHFSQQANMSLSLLVEQAKQRQA
ncbi:MAG: HDOD domain-containing protein [Oceanicoccus sp.]